MRLFISTYRLSKLARISLLLLAGMMYSFDALAGVHYTDPVTTDPYKTTEFTVDGPGTLKVFTLNGDIEVIRTSSDKKVKIELYVDRGYAFWSKSKNLDNYRITMLQKGNEVVASVEEKSKDTGLFSDQMTFTFKVYVPESMSTELKTHGGNIDLDGLFGNHMMKTSGGNITVHDSRGKIAAYTAGGNIDFNEVTGTIFAQTEGGNIVLDEAKGEIRLKVKGGNIVGKQLAGSMLVQSDGGDIQAGFESVSQGISLVTTAGDIEIELPENDGYHLNALGNRIYLDDDFRFSGDSEAKKIDGNLGRGGSTVNLQTEFGTIRIIAD